METTTTTSINTYAKLRRLLPDGYRQTIAKETGLSTSHIDKVLRGVRRDTRGVLVVAYRLAAEEQMRRYTERNELKKLKKQLKAS